jgi:hypothetical protein
MPPGPKPPPATATATPATASAPGHVAKTGTVTLRHNGRLHHIGIGREHAGTPILLLARDLQVRIIAARTGELLRDLVLDPGRNYQPTGRPPGPTSKPPKP